MRHMRHTRTARGRSFRLDDPERALRREHYQHAARNETGFSLSGGARCGENSNDRALLGALSRYCRSRASELPP